MKVKILYTYFAFGTQTFALSLLIDTVSCQINKHSTTSYSMSQNYVETIACFERQ